MRQLNFINEAHSIMGGIVAVKYGESVFDVLYLLFAIIIGIQILSKAHSKTEKLMGLAALILGCGDAFHLVPRVLNYFWEADFTAALGIGKLITSITMTVFYVLLYYIWLGHYHEKENASLTVCIWILALIRIALCLLPQNRWAQNSSNVVWGTIRNVPFIILGAEICWLYCKKRKETAEFRFIWLYILLSFLFYIPVTLLAGVIPVLGMLMLPKTVCYIFMLFAFIRCTGKEQQSC